MQLKQVKKVIKVFQKVSTSYYFNKAILIFKYQETVCDTGV